MDSNSTVSVSGQTSDTETPNGQTPNPQGQTAQSGSQKTPIESLPADVQEYIKSLRKEAETANKQIKAQEQARKQADEQRMKEQGQYKELAEKHQTRVHELEPIAQSYSQLSARVRNQIESQIKDWPAELKAFDPGPDAPIESRLAWLEKSKPLLEKLQQQARSQLPGNSPNPRPATMTKAQEIDALGDQFRRTRGRLI